MEQEKTMPKPKSKGKKILAVLAITVVVLIVAGVVLFSVFGDKAIRAGIEVGAKKAMQVNVSLEDITTALLRGKVELTNLEIDNPEGYQHETFMTLGHASLALDTGSLFSDTIVMDKIQLDDITVVIEQKGTTSNLQAILDNLPQSESTEADESDDSQDEEAAGKNFRINTLEINGVTVKAKLLPIPGRADTLTFKLNPIQMENIGTEEKVNAAELTSKIMLAIAGGIAEQGKDLLPTEMIGDLAGGLAEQGVKIFETGADIGTGIGKEATGLIQGLFKKDQETTDSEDEQ